MQHSACTRSEFPSLSNNDVISYLYSFLGNVSLEVQVFAVCVCVCVCVDIAVMS